MEKNRSKTDKRLKNLKTDAGPGRPKGQRNYATLYRLAMEKIAEAEGMSFDDFEIKFVQQAIRKGFNGDTRLYTDTLDRIHGKAQQKTDITSDGKPMQTNGVVFMDFSKPDQGKPEFIDPNNAKS